MFEDGTLKVPIEMTIPLERAAEAHAMIDAGHRKGKLVLTTGDDA
jgi:NADPH2:quinone reductase